MLKPYAEGYVETPQVGKIRLPSDEQPHKSLDAKVNRLNRSFENASAEFLLEHVLTNEFPDKTALVSSFGTEAAILLHMISRINPDLDVIFINTGKLFTLTLKYRDLLVERFGLTNVKEVRPKLDDLEKYDPNGDLWMNDVDACCHIRKVKPNNNAVSEFTCLISGRKRYHGASRVTLKKFELSEGQIKVNPLAYWERAQINSYFEKHGIPPHPLLERGYLSVGCHHCSSPSFDPSNPRSGRWTGKRKTECGIHLPGNTQN